jgi:glycosyltransferase involved in cell wall biosynthesis
MNNPLVSIIIPTYNRAHLIGETLDSVLAQTYPNWECIIVDDGSIDNTAEVVNNYIQKDNRFQLHYRPADRLPGGNASRNYGFEVSKGEYVNWFDDDDIMHPDKLNIQVENLENSDYNFSVCQTLVFENTFENIIGLRHKKIYSIFSFEDYLTDKIVWMTPSAIWRKDFLLTFEYLFDEELRAAQEWEFHCRVLFVCRDYHYIYEPLVYIRKHNESISYNKNKETREISYFKTREKIFDLIKNSSVMSKELRNYFNNYFLFYFKVFTISRNIKMSFYILYNRILLNKNIGFEYKLKMLIAFFSFLLLNKGEILFKIKR